MTQRMRVVSISSDRDFDVYAGNSSNHSKFKVVTASREWGEVKGIQLLHAFCSNSFYNVVDSKAIKNTQFSFRTKKATNAGGVISVSDYKYHSVQVEPGYYTLTGLKNELKTKLETELTSEGYTTVNITWGGLSWNGLLELTIRGTGPNIWLAGWGYESLNTSSGIYSPWFHLLGFQQFSIDSTNYIDTPTPWTDALGTIYDTNQDGTGPWPSNFMRIDATFQPNLRGPSTVHIQCPQLCMGNISTLSSEHTFATIPMDVAYGGVSFRHYNNEGYFFDHVKHISTLEFELFDDEGLPLDIRGGSWGVTFAIIM